MPDNKTAVVTLNDVKAYAKKHTPALYASGSEDRRIALIDAVKALTGKDHIDAVAWLIWQGIKL